MNWRERNREIVLCHVGMDSKSMDIMMMDGWIDDGEPVRRAILTQTLE